MNKAIDRQIFMDVLVRFHGYRCLRDYTYVGFGGPFLADYTLIENHVDLGRLISLEADPTTHRRQLFNRPTSRIECRQQTSGEFLQRFTSEGIENLVLWLDYANANERRVQLDEVQAYAERVPDFSILKVTINATPDAIRTGNSKAIGDELMQLRFEAVEKDLGDYLKPEVSARDMTSKAFPRVVMDCIRRAAAKAMRIRDQCEFVPITSFAYQDQHIMVTLTGVVLPETHVRELKAKLGLSKWPLAFDEESTPVPIRAPVLSARERAHWEERLPKFRRTLGKRSQFKLSDDEDEHLESADSFQRFSRYYPHFSRIIP